jgi:hypothetical protein
VADYCYRATSTLAADAKTWFVDANITYEQMEGSSCMFLTVRGGAYEGYFRYFKASNQLQFQYYGVVSSVQIIKTNAIPSGTTLRVKMAARIENNNFAFYMNGSQIGTDTIATRGTNMTTMEIGTYGGAAAYNIDGTINEVALFGNALTNAELASLTSL